MAVTSHPGGAGLAEGGMLLPGSYPFTSGLRVLGDAGVLEYPFAAGPAVDGGNIGGVDQEANRLRLHPADGAASLVDVESADPWHRQAAYLADCLEAGRAPEARHGRAGARRTAHVARGEPLAGNRKRRGGLSMATGFVCDERYFWWDTRSAGLFMPSHPAIGVEPDVHAESRGDEAPVQQPARPDGPDQAAEPVEPRMATVEEVARCHSTEHIERMKALSDDNGGDAGELTPFAPGGYEIALLAAGGVMAAVDAVLGRSATPTRWCARRATSAERDRGRGFCMFANCTIAARHAREALA